MAVAPEVLPVAERVLLRPLLIPLTALVAYMFGWGLCQALDAFVKAVFGAVEGGVGWIPFAGRLIGRPIHSLEHRISSYIGGWVAHFESQFFTRWHALGSLFRNWSGEIEQAAHFSFRAAHEIAKLYGLLATGNLKAFRAEIARISKVQTHVVTQHLGRIDRRGHTYAPASVTAHVGVLEGEIGHVIDWDIPRLKARTRATEDSLERLWHRVRGKEKLLVGTAFAGAVAVALGRLGLGWLRCTSFRNIGKTIGCGGFALFEDLLKLGLEVLVVADICQIANAIETAAILVEPELDKLVGLSDFICRAGGASYPSGILDSDKTGRGGNPTALVAADLAA